MPKFLLVAQMESLMAGANPWLAAGLGICRLCRQMGVLPTTRTQAALSVRRTARQWAGQPARLPTQNFHPERLFSGLRAQCRQAFSPVGAHVLVEVGSL